MTLWHLNKLMESLDLARLRSVCTVTDGPETQRLTNIMRQINTEAGKIYKKIKVELDSIQGGN